MIASSENVPASPDDDEVLEALNWITGEAEAMYELLALMNDAHFDRQRMRDSLDVIAGALGFAPGPHPDDESETV